MAFFKINKRHSLILAMTAIILHAFIMHTFAQSGAKNVLFIAVDDLKPLLSNYGHKQMHTPNFDRLSKMGATFTHAYVQQAVCGPSRASVMTGVPPDRTRVWDLHTDFRHSAPDLISMPEYLITQGYETTGIGKIYHKGSASPGHDGKSWSIPHIIPYNFDGKYGAPAFGTYQDPCTKAEMNKIKLELIASGITKGLRKKVMERLKPSTESVDVPDEAYLDGLYTKEAIKRMKNLAKGDKPFFLAVGFQKPHLPFVAPKKYWDLYDRDSIKLDAPQSYSKGTPAIAYHPNGELRSYTDIPDDLEKGEALPEAKQKELIHGYMAATSYIDAQIGKLLDTYYALGLDTNTIIVLWGDHGYHLGDHTLWCKHSNFEQATHIPLIIAGPGIAKNIYIDRPVELLDLFPTIFDALNIDIPDQVEGISLYPLIDGDDSTAPPQKDYAISQYHRRKTVEGYSIRTGRYRYTEWHTNYYRSYNPYDEKNIVATELYDYEKDPWETENLIDNPDYKEIKKQLKAKLKKHLMDKYQYYKKNGVNDSLPVLHTYGKRKTKSKKIFFKKKNKRK